MTRLLSQIALLPCRAVLTCYTAGGSPLQRPPTTFAGAFTEWLNERGLRSTSEIDIPTQDGWNVLDLTFVSSSLSLLRASTMVAHHLDATSKHRPLLTRLPWK